MIRNLININIYQVSNGLNSKTFQVATFIRAIFTYIHHNVWNGWDMGSSL